MAQRALEYALENHPDAEITVLNVVGEPSPMFGAAMGLALEDDPKRPPRSARRKSSIALGKSPPSTMSRLAPSCEWGNPLGRF